MSAEEEKGKDEKGKIQNDFINQRLTWLGTFSSLLFVANGFWEIPRFDPDSQLRNCDVHLGRHH